jgi:hypothetical protein
MLSRTSSAMKQSSSLLVSRTKGTVSIRKWNHRGGRTSPLRATKRKTTASPKECEFNWGWMPRPTNFRHRAKGWLLLMTSPFAGLRRVSQVISAGRMAIFRNRRLQAQLPVCRLHDHWTGSVNTTPFNSSIVMPAPSEFLHSSLTSRDNSS